MNLPTNPNQKALSKLAGQMPIMSQQALQQKAAQSTIALQQAVAQTPAQAPVAQAAQALGAQQTQALGQAQVQTQQAAQQGLAQAGQQVLQGQVSDAENGLKRKALETSKKNREALEGVNSLSSQLKNKLFDSQLTFQKDEANRTLFNEQQLMDYKLSQGLADEDLANYEQSVSNLTQRKLRLLQVAQEKIKMEINQQFQSGQQSLDQDQQEFLMRKKQEIEAKIAREKARAKNRAAMFSAVGTVVGAAAGAVIAGPGGYAAGASVGASLGGAAGNLAASQ
jgi:hypothetical protein